MHPVWHEFEKMVSQVVKKNNSEENICRKIFFKEMTLLCIQHNTVK